ncbi:MAG: transposase [Endomicrobiales bacterium]|nr:transposase [Endomicrobiales bacterium]
MPRTARVTVEGYPYHIMQRGNYGQDIFKTDQDRHQYLAWIIEYSLKYHLQILAFCLMNNHVHFTAIPQKKDSLSKTFNMAHMRYSQYVNNKNKTMGHLWQGRFYSCMLDKKHLLAASRYVERNPVRAGLAKRPWEWEWSSANVHIHEISDKNSRFLKLFEYVDLTPQQWKGYISENEDDFFVEQIERNTISGRPVGDADFIKKLKDKFGIKIEEPVRGRPKKTRKTGTAPI